MNSIFHYLNYRTFLKDFYEARKIEKSTYSYRVFNKTAGLKSPSLYKQICDGTRALTEKTIAQFVKGLNLNKKEALFFRTLVYFNQAETEQDKNLYYKQLCHFKEHTQIQKVKSDQFDFFFYWYNLAVYELSRFGDFRENPQWIARKLQNSITEAEALNSLKLLQQLGLLVPDPKTKKLKPVNKNIATDPEVFSLVVANFHKSMMQKAQTSLMQDHHKLREISALTIAVDAAGFEEAKKRIQEFCQELNILLSGTTKPDRVYQLNFQLFPLTTTKEMLS